MLWSDPVHQFPRWLLNHLRIFTYWDIEFDESNQMISLIISESDIYIWISMSIIYFDTQMPEKYSTAMCYFLTGQL